MGPYLPPIDQLPPDPSVSSDAVESEDRAESTQAPAQKNNEPTGFLGVQMVEFGETIVGIFPFLDQREEATAEGHNKFMKMVGWGTTALLSISLMLLLRKRKPKKRRRRKMATRTTRRRTYKRRKR